MEDSIATEHDYTPAGICRRCGAGRVETPCPGFKSTPSTSERTQSQIGGAASDLTSFLYTVIDICRKGFWPGVFVGIATWWFFKPAELRGNGDGVSLDALVAAVGVLAIVGFGMMRRAGWF